MICLGIETSCDETSIAVVKDGKKILSNVISSSLVEHGRYGGVVPEIASRAHLETLIQSIDAALKKSRQKLSDINLIAVTQGPGLMGSLLVGLSAAKSLSYTLQKPLVGVDHVIAHVYSGFLTDAKLRFPCLGLVVSGGHTMTLRMDSPSRVQVIGKTIDDAAGEAFDKVAKMLGLGYPGGPEIDRLAKGQDPNRIPFKRPYLASDSPDFSFSGLKTAVYYWVGDLKKKNKKLTPQTKKNICAGFQEAVCDVLVKKSLDAAKKEGLKAIVVGGGVSANSRLRSKLAAAARKEGIRAVFPPMALCQDNAAMIAALGTALHREGRADSLDLQSYPEFRLN